MRSRYVSVGNVSMNLFLTVFLYRQNLSIKLIFILKTLRYKQTEYYNVTMSQSDLTIDQTNTLFAHINNYNILRNQPPAPIDGDMPPPSIPVLMPTLNLVEMQAARERLDEIQGETAIVEASGYKNHGRFFYVRVSETIYYITVNNLLTHVYNVKLV